MEVNFDPIYRGEALFKEAEYPHLESYAEVYRTAVGDAVDQLAANGEGLKKKHTRVIDLNEELCDLLNEIEKAEFSLKEFEGLEGKNIYDDDFEANSLEINTKLVDLKKMKSRPGTAKKILIVSLMVMVAGVITVNSLPFSLPLLAVYLVVEMISFFTACVSGRVVTDASDYRNKIKSDLKDKGYMDEEGNAIAISINPVKLKLEESLVDLRAKLAEKETQVKKAEREFSETHSSVIQMVNQKGIIEEKFDGSLFVSTGIDDKTTARINELNSAKNELEKAERYIKTLQDKGVIPKQLCTVPEVVTAVTKSLSQLVA